MDSFNIHEKVVKDYGEYPTQRLVLEAWDAQQAVVGPNAQPATAIIVESRPMVRSSPTKAEANQPLPPRPKRQRRPKQPNR